MNILVTGSNGFIGSHVVNWLKEKNCYIIGLDLGEASTSEVDEYLCCDLYTEATGKIFDNISVTELDAIVHLAADMRKEPYTLDVIQNNCIGVQRLLELCRDKNVGTFVQLSSLPVIGNPVDTPITELHSLKPPTVYHCKLRILYIWRAYSQLSNLCSRWTKNESQNHSPRLYEQGA